MKVFLDSSFFFPFIGVEVKNYPTKAILDLIKLESIEIYRSELVIFELSAKGTKYVKQGALSIEDVINGINSIYYSLQVEVIPIHYSEIQSLAAELRHSHSDFIDCLTLASAVHHSDLFLTFDLELHSKAQSEWSRLLSIQNKRFKVLLWKDFHLDEEK
ncbi:MAG: PIN domain-containing protein [Candidatus Hodarchaeota archaeon]